MRRERASERRGERARAWGLSFIPEGRRGARARARARGNAPSASRRPNALASAPPSAAPTGPPSAIAATHAAHALGATPGIAVAAAAFMTDVW